ncbi:hypothetical protein V2J09_008140 [Rumex salicifolius]
MFEGVHQDQFHQFLAAAASNSTSISSSSSTSHHHLLHHHQQQQQQPTPLSFSLLHGCNTSSSSPSLFHHDPYNNNNNNPVQLHPHQHILHQQQIQWAPPSDAHSKQHHHQINGGGGVIKQERQGEAVSTNITTHGGFLAMERQRSMAEEEEADLIDSSAAVAWSHDELLALLRIRSALENWFPEFTWEHVSRKLSELGFKRSPQKCKERFEEESRSYFHAAKNNDVTSMENDVICPTSKNNYRLFNELEELCHHRHDPPPPPPPPQPPHHHHHHHQSMDVINPREDVNVNQGDAILDKQNPQREEGREERQVEDDSEQEERVKSLDGGSEAIDKADQQENIETQQRFKKDRMNKKKKKKKKFEIFKTFCEEIVSKMMSHQEDLHKKILQDMIKRDEEKIAREDAWKNQEMERINKEMEARARDLAMVSDRQAKIIEFLKKFTSDSSTNTMITSKKDANNEAPKSTHQNPSSSATHSSPNHLPTSSNEGSISQSSNPTKNRPNIRKSRPNKRARSDNCSDGNDIGKRWPREEVLALISIRCNVDLASKTGPDDSGQNRNNSNSNSSNKNPPLWERISHKMVEMGYSRSAKRCKEKWENINKYFRKTKDMNKNRSVDSRTCPYFHQLNHLYNQGRVAGGGGGADGGCGGGSDGGEAMNVDISDQGEDASAVQVTLSAACDLEF